MFFSDNFILELLGILLGVLQGLFEWLPVSSEGQLALILANIIEADVDTATSLALFAHIGTAIVVLVYYRKEFLKMTSVVIDYTQNKIKTLNKNESEKEINQTDKKLLLVLIITTISTLPTALLSLLIFESVIEEVSQNYNFDIGSTITLIVGLFLIITGVILYLRPENTKSNTEIFEKISWKQAIVLGLIQGLAAVPGLSRSGLTITYLLIGTKTSQNETLRGSFIISVPVTLGAGLLQILRGKIFFSAEGITNIDNVLIINYMGALLMIISAFIAGLATLTLFLRLANQISFDKFMIVFGLIAISLVLIGFL